MTDYQNRDILGFIESGLIKTGFDGLVCPISGCGCLIGDLSPGECLSDQCVPGYKHTHSTKPDRWAITTYESPLTDADIEELNGY